MMTPDEHSGDPVLAALSNLLAWDVDERRAHRLRVRCHKALAGQDSAAAAAADGRPARWIQIAGGVILGAWCVTYLVEIVRRAAAVHGL
jgi:hypothetical protein